MAKKKKPLTSQDMAKDLLKMGEKKAISKAKESLKCCSTLEREVYWRAVLYHIKTLTK